jgi:hypothetical protein
MADVADTTLLPKHRPEKGFERVASSPASNDYVNHGKTLLGWKRTFDSDLLKKSVEFLVGTTELFPED